MKLKIRGRLILLAFFILPGVVLQAQYSWNNLPSAQLPAFPADTFNIKQHGAIADGTTLNTSSINKAINACSTKGGGVVLIPEGLWLTGPIVMKSNVNLHLNSAAILQFTDDFNQYALMESNFEGQKQMRNQSPLSGDNLENIAITGTGIIDGNGDAWRMVTKDKLTENEWKTKVASGGLVSADGRTWFPSEKTKRAHEEKINGVISPGRTVKDFEAIKDYLRPNLVVLSNCKKVLLEGVTFQNSPAWCLHPLLCEDLTVRNIFAKNPDYAQNGDGIDIESCKNVLVEGSKFDVGDDGICIKSGKDEEGRKRAKPTENVVIRNNTVYKGHGGFVIGSEMSGGAKNIFVYDCSFFGTAKGLRFKTARGRGGIVEKIYCRNIFMKDIDQEAVYFDMYYFAKPPKPGEKTDSQAVTAATPQFRDFYISDIVCNGAATGVFIRGLPEMAVDNVQLSNIRIKSVKGIEIIEAQKISFKNVQMDVAQKSQVFYAENSNNILIDGLSGDKNAGTVFNISGSRSRDIKLTGTNNESAKSKIILTNGAAENAVEVK